jgi:hypothetical protein
MSIRLSWLASTKPMSGSIDAEINLALTTELLGKSLGFFGPDTCMESVR